MRTALSPENQQTSVTGIEQPVLMSGQLSLVLLAGPVPTA
jgi:hypothetical protein